VYVTCIVAINFVADLVLIPLCGLAGAATATALAVVSSAVLVRVLARRLARVPI
jgi:peptidoglycan biosynthesis protein MviN/MurJ (putative lipid II flippase)